MCVFLCDRFSKIARASRLLLQSEECSARRKNDRYITKVRTVAPLRKYCSSQRLKLIGKGTALCIRKNRAIKKSSLYAAQLSNLFDLHRSGTLVRRLKRHKNNKGVDRAVSTIRIASTAHCGTDEGDNTIATVEDDIPMSTRTKQHQYLYRYIRHYSSYLIHRTAEQNASANVPVFSAVNPPDIVSNFLQSTLPYLYGRLDKTALIAMGIVIEELYAEWAARIMLSQLND